MNGRAGPRDNLASTRSRRQRGVPRANPGANAEITRALVIPISISGGVLLLLYGMTLTAG
jgi:hypothetical protein